METFLTVCFSALVLLGVYFLGIFSLLGYMVIRMLRADNWDDSNIHNALRVIAHFVAHPHDCAKMYYLDEEQLMLLWKNDMDPKKPFHYINKDEFSELMKTRPWND